MRPGFLFLLLSLCVSSVLYAQNSDIMRTLKVDEGYARPDPKLKLRYPVLHAGAGAVFYTGSMRAQKQYDKFIRASWGLQFGIEQRVGRYIGFQAQLLYGHVTSNVQTAWEFKNFRSRIISPDIRIALHFDHITSRKASVAPFISVGAGMLHFESYTDLYDKNNIFYHAWQDGTLRSKPELPGNENALILERDYRFDTQVTPARRNVFQLTGEAGIKFKILNFWDFQFSYTQYYSFGSFTPFSGKNDSYGFMKAGLTYYFGQVNYLKKTGGTTP